MHNKADEFLQRVQYALASEQLQLPSLPEVAVRVREECEKDEASAQKIAEALSQDSALSVRLMQVANSALYRTRQPAENLPAAITRLGLRLVRDIITGLAMKQLYQASTDVLQERFREIWLASVKTAAISRMLATQHKQLNPEQAMLAGLTHNIGALPVLLMAEEEEDLLHDASALREVIRDMQGKLGVCIFKAWHFPGFMSDVALECYNFERSHHGQADYIDVVQAALIQGSLYTGLECPEDWASIPAFGKLGINTDSNMLDIEENRIVFDTTEALFC